MSGTYVGRIRDAWSHEGIIDIGLEPEREGRLLCLMRLFGDSTCCIDGQRTIKEYEFSASSPSVIPATRVRQRINDEKGSKETSLGRIREAESKARTSKAAIGMN